MFNFITSANKTIVFISIALHFVDSWNEICDMKLESIVGKHLENN